ncbi:MAG: sarcosine oxidase subunit gamma family protein, partial [Alphaproteobacteria bacterium]|nr:sarcosine oxidase subunit gamma family protein [Alphaproteobacteria bacterium]
MADTQTEMSPLDGRAGSGADTAIIVEHPHLGKVNLRGDSGDQAFMDAVAGAVGAPPPVEANTVVKAGKNSIFWLGPNEWLIVTPEGKQGETEAALRTALEGQYVSIVDGSDAR